jgi:hypothetical protein
MAFGERTDDVIAVADDVIGAACHLGAAGGRGHHHRGGRDHDGSPELAGGLHVGSLLGRCLSGTGCGPALQGDFSDA